MVETFLFLRFVSRERDLFILEFFFEAFEDLEPDLSFFFILPAEDDDLIFSSLVSVNFSFLDLLLSTSEAELLELGCLSFLFRPLWKLFSPSPL